MPKKTREDFTDAEIKKVHSELEGMLSVAERASVYKKHGASRQAFSNWFHVLGLPQLSEAKPGGITSQAAEKRRVGRPKGPSKSKKAIATPKAAATGAAAKRGRPVGSSRKSQGGLSHEAKETLIRLLADQTAMMRRLLEN
ncbi:MAG: hypothetical protein IOD12_06940 [Silvanigrellales bacterium]|nr:hypothetical protein [Silvanigrellales bacterium]